MAAPVTVNDVLDGQVALDLECLDRVYLNVYVPNLQVGGLWGSRTRSRPLTCGSGCTLVLVDQASKDRTAPDLPVVEVRVGMIGAWREEP